MNSARFSVAVGLTIAFRSTVGQLEMPIAAGVMFGLFHKAFPPGLNGTLRIVAALLPWPAVPSFLVCSRHFCDCGHLVHGPYPSWYQFSDRFWIFSFMAAAILAVCSDMPRRFHFAGLLVLLASLRLLLGSPGQLFDVLVLAAVAWLGLHAVIKKRKRNDVRARHCGHIAS